MLKHVPEVEMDSSIAEHVGYRESDGRGCYKSKQKRLPVKSQKNILVRSLVI